MKIEQRFKYKNELLLAKKLIVKCYKQSTKDVHMNIKVKDDKSLVSNVDINLEKSLISAIRKVYKGDNFSTEETSNNTDLSNRTWVIDPIDGTAFFVRNCQFYSVQLAFYDEGETQFSIIYLPKSHDMYVAIRGVGAFLNNKKSHLVKGICRLKDVMLLFVGLRQNGTAKQLRKLKRYIIMRNKSINLQNFC